MAKPYVVVREQPDRSGNWYKYLYTNIKKNGEWTTECLQYLGKADGPEDKKITKDMIDDDVMDEHDIDVQDINEANIRRKWTRTGYKNDPSHVMTVEERNGKYVVVVDMKESGHYAEKEFDTKEEALDYAKKKRSAISNTWESQEGWQDILDKTTGKEALEDSAFKTETYNIMYEDDADSLEEQVWRNSQKYDTGAKVKVKTNEKEKDFTVFHEDDADFAAEEAWRIAMNNIDESPEIEVTYEKMPKSEARRQYASEYVNVDEYPNGDYPDWLEDSMPKELSE